MHIFWTNPNEMLVVAVVWIALFGGSLLAGGWMVVRHFLKGHVLKGRVPKARA